MAVPPSSPGRNAEISAEIRATIGFPGPNVTGRPQIVTTTTCLLWLAAAVSTAFSVE
jgi:hypothetical protein